MFQRTLATLHRTASALNGLALRRLPAPRVVSTFALAGLLLSVASPLAEAHSTHGYTLDFFRLHVVDESGEVGSDEPYVLMAVVNLVTRELAVRRTSVFSDVDSGESRLETVRLWGPSGATAALPGNNPDNLIILVQPMEHDDCGVDSELARVQRGLRTRFNEIGVAPRDYTVARLREHMDALTDPYCLVFFPWETIDDSVASPQELRITAADVSAAHGGTTVEKQLNHNDGGTVYRTFFRLQAAPSPLAAPTLPTTILAP
jgi:hypothetical protein